MASESCTSIKQLIESINLRIKYSDEYKSQTESTCKAREWVNQYVKEYFQDLCKTYLENNNSSHWENVKSERIASPSDVGIHNTIKNIKGLNFIDFEYAGQDDLSKLAADWIMQPQYYFGEGEEKPSNKPTN